jgi:uncharacterized Zn finger protein (UPF0148 family)
MVSRYRHCWTCDTCHKFVQQGAVRCVTCTFDVRAEEESRRRFHERLDATIRRIDAEIAKERDA